MEHKYYTEIHAGTAVTREILDRLGAPDDALKIIHIAGTNGKGSTAEFFTQILIAAGKRVGTFTSPAVYGFYDQFRIDGHILPAELAEKYFDRAKKAAEGLNATDFEIQTAGILLAFKEEGCEYAVLECGMGGLGDATNAINKKELAVITSVSLEHTAYLGDTIEKICEQKAGIIKGGCPVVINANQPEEAVNYFKKHAILNFANRLTYVGNIDKNYRNVFWYCDKEYELSVEGAYQCRNAAAAIEGARILGLPQQAVYDGIKNAQPRGRVERFSAFGRNYILDGAHNPAAFAPLAECLGNTPREEITIIFGCLKDKDLNGNLSALAPLTDKIIAVECKSPRAMPLEKTEEGCRKYFKNVTTAQSVTAALNAAFTKTVVVCGSFTLLKEAKLWIEQGQ